MKKIVMKIKNFLNTGMRERPGAALLRGVVDPFHPYAPTAVASERKRVGKPHVLDTGNRRYAANDAFEISDALLATLELARGIDAPRHGALLSESEIHVEHRKKAAHEQATADEQHARERHFRHHQSLAHPGARPPDTRASAGVGERRILVPR